MFWAVGLFIYLNKQTNINDHRISNGNNDVIVLITIIVNDYCV